ncbi:hypothetical protein [Kibdelosporangium phytohabitans]|uniref:Terminase n=1 Tax=Kibdelosporangium phytohabitans TaxID=860235 RepID=A0A0N9HU17_9PSEU|nr:hypothetical protein [Kibdelosporangium phytohabitans]ALG06841.1 hypothetical protein AOZ06_07770 [Kibdelosporangium phytohabitans]MBE1468088.1 hypothetical protein [Kibdelosporangium phytohabitans]
MTTTKADEYVVNFPTLWIVPDWIEQHCIVPDRFQKGQPFELYDWQLWCTVNHYRVKPTAKFGQLSTAFFYRRSLIVAPQKTGKGPWSAAIVAAEACGPVVFAGWAEEGDVYRCEDHGCYCGWEYEYQPGEPMGRPWPTPLIQLTATSDDQTDNVYRPLKAMARAWPLNQMMRVGEEFIRIGDDGLIDTVTSSALSRLGNPINCALQDETGLYTATNKLLKVAETQRRGAAGMGGRSMETTNPWDPAEDSVAQRTYQSLRPDIFKFYRIPPKNLSYLDKRERRKIHAYVYRGSLHVDLDAIEAEAAELIEKDPGQAERFFGNRVVPGTGSWCDVRKWDDRKVKAPRSVPRKTQIVLGFDGSDTDDWTGFRAETQDGYQFTPTFGSDKRPTVWNPADHGGQVPRLEVRAALDELFEFFTVIRMYADPPDWETEIDDWAAAYGEKRVLRFSTFRWIQMHAAAERLLTDVTKQDSTFSHDGCGIASDHVAHTRKSARPGKPPRYVLEKASQTEKIDLTVCSILAHEAAGDVTAAKLWKPARKLVVMR